FAIGAVGEPADRAIENAVDVGYATAKAALLPVGPRQAVDGVRRHEHDEQKLRVVLLGEPARHLDLLRCGTLDDPDVHPAARVERKRVVEGELPQAATEGLGELPPGASARVPRG